MSAPPSGRGSGFSVAIAAPNSLPRERIGGAGADLAAILNAVAAGRYPPPDGTVTILSQPSPRDAGVIALTGSSVIFADTDPDWIATQLPPGDLSAPLAAPFLAALSERLRRRSHSVDMITCAGALPGPLPPDLPLTELAIGGGRASHPRVARALRYRDDVRAWQTTGGVLLVGHGVAGRWEVAIEVDPECRSHG